MRPLPERERQLQGESNRGQCANLDKLKLEESLSSMARSVRVEFPGAFYHVMARGNRREPIFLDKEDGKQFVKALGKCAR